MATARIGVNDQSCSTSQFYVRLANSDLRALSCFNVCNARPFEAETETHTVRASETDTHHKIQEKFTCASDVQGVRRAPIRIHDCLSARAIT